MNDNFCSTNLQTFFWCAILLSNPDWIYKHYGPDRPWCLLFHEWLFLYCHIVRRLCPNQYPLLHKNGYNCHGNVGCLDISEFQSRCIIDCYSHGISQILHSNDYFDIHTSYWGLAVMMRKHYVQTHVRWTKKYSVLKSVIRTKMHERSVMITHILMWYLRNPC